MTGRKVWKHDKMGDLEECKMADLEASHGGRSRRMTRWQDWKNARWQTWKGDQMGGLEA